MGFDFETRIDRRGTGAAKWDARLAAHNQPAPGAAFEGGGPEPIALSVADMEFAAPPCVLDAIARRLAHGIFGYTIPGPAYREAAAAWQLARHGWAMAPDWVLTSSGVIPALHQLVRGLVEPGRKVLLQTPVFPPFVDSIAKHGRTVATAPLRLQDGHYVMDMVALEEALADPEVAMFVLCNPHNPVGRAWDAHDLEAVAAAAAHHGVMVVSDEIHGDLMLPGHRFTPFASVAGAELARTIVLNGLSKTMNLAGLQLCNVVVPDAALREKVQGLMWGNGHFGVNPLSEAAFVAGWTEGGPWLDALMRHVEGNWRRVGAFLGERLPGARVIRPEATYLLWVDLREIGLSPPEIVERLVTRARVRLEDGTAFGEGGAGFFRVNLACPGSMLDEALERIAAALGSNR